MSLHTSQAVTVCNCVCVCSMRGGIPETNSVFYKPSNWMVRFANISVLSRLCRLLFGWCGFFYPFTGCHKMDIWNKSVLIRRRKKGREKTFVTSKSARSVCLPGIPCLIDASHDEKTGLFFYHGPHSHPAAQGGNIPASQLRLMDYVKYAEDVWETDIFCLTWTILKIKPIQADRQSDDSTDVQEMNFAMNQGRPVHTHLR